MINGKTIKKSEIVPSVEDDRTELVLTFTDGTSLCVMADSELNFFWQERTNGRTVWVNPSNLVG